MNLFRHDKSVEEAINTASEVYEKVYMGNDHGEPHDYYGDAHLFIKWIEDDWKKLGKRLNVELDFDDITERFLDLL